METSKDDYISKDNNMTGISSNYSNLNQWNFNISEPKPSLSEPICTESDHEAYLPPINSLPSFTQISKETVFYGNETYKKFQNIMDLLFFQGEDLSNEDLTWMKSTSSKDCFASIFLKFLNLKKA